MAAPVALTHKQAVNREKDIQEELERLHGKADKTAEEYAAVPKLLEEFRNVNTHRLELEHEAALAEIRSAMANSTMRVERPPASSTDGEIDGVDHARNPDDDRAPAGKRFRDPWDLSQVRTFGREPSSVSTELRSRAVDAVARMPLASDKVREIATDLLERSDDSESRLSRLCLATSSEAYMRAFSKLIRSKGQPSILEPKEAEAYTRAMSLTDAAGGFLVPFQLDPTVILTAAGSRNPLRLISRKVQVTGDTWNGISSAGVSGSWDAEAAEVSDDAPTFASPAIPVYKGAVFVPISIEAQQDEQNVAVEIARMIAFEKDRMESVAFTTGSGSGEPTGIVTALTGTASVIPSATADTFAAADIYALDSALPDRFAANASWVAHRAIFNLVRRFDTQGGANMWEQLGAGMPGTLLGRPAYTNEAMDSTITALAANLVAIFGDFENYVIADRVGTTVEYIPHLFGASRRPTGQRGWYAYFRVGADSVNDAAFRMLDVT